MDGRVQQALNLFFRERFDDAKLDVVTAGCIFRYPESVELRDPHNFQQEVRIRPGDDIEGEFEYVGGKGKCYRRINKMVEVEMPAAWGGQKMLLICPTDFKVVLWVGDEPDRYKRGLPLIKLALEYKSGHVGRACPMGQMIRQVLIAHRCLLTAPGTPLLLWYQIAVDERKKYCIMYDECQTCDGDCPELARLERKGVEFRRVLRGGQPLSKKARLELEPDVTLCTSKKVKKWCCGGRNIYHAYDKKVAFRRSKRNVKTYPPPVRAISTQPGDGGANRGDKPADVNIYTDDDDDDDDDGDDDGDSDDGGANDDDGFADMNASDDAAL
jgi:hypothetical protein